MKTPTSRCVMGKEKKKNLKHILVYSCAGDWISYTAGSMPFMSKATKKCNNGVDHSLHLVSSVFCVDVKTFYRVQIYVRTISKKKKKTTTGKPKTNINTTVYLWENYLKLPSFSSHKAWQNLTSSTMTTVQSGFIWTRWKLQRQRQVTHDGSAEIYRLFKGVRE